MADKAVFLGDRDDLCGCRPRLHAARWVVFAHVLHRDDLPSLCPHWRMPNWDATEQFELNTDNKAAALKAFRTWERWVRA